MIINFKKIIIHNFLSYGHAELDLRDKHYCLVKGENRGLVDNATSNGAGKSSWSSAICWALTGETIQGLSSNIKNINVDENLCYVDLEFSVDADEFRICRYKNPKSDLKIQLNGEDISGKGIRESEDVLARYLPDLTSQLIASIIILGQGLPNKFTDNTPSGRKEVLEKLSKSDFMINDLKSRIADRHQELKDKLRECEDLILSNQSKRVVISNALLRATNSLSELNKPIDFDIAIYNLERKISQLKLDIDSYNEQISTLKRQQSETLISQTAQINQQNQEILEEQTDFEQFRSEYSIKRAEYVGKIKSLDDYIEKIQKIVDKCPTCGQALPDIHKADLTKEISEANDLKQELILLDSKYNNAVNVYNQTVLMIKEKYQSTLAEISRNIAQFETLIKELESSYKAANASMVDAQMQCNNLVKDKAELSIKIKAAEREVLEYKNELDSIDNLIKAETANKDELNERLQIINQMNTLIKRDFRGYLLSEIIDFIAAKSREYCLDIFKTDFIEFTLEGNNINISYAGKAFENLSGGEKQRIDLIIQFAIRNMMEQYLNFSSNILVLDEIFDQLDAVGCESVLELITSKLVDVESIFIISHRADELEIPCDYELTVIKDEQGVSTIKCL